MNSVTKNTQNIQRVTEIAPHLDHCKNHGTLPLVLCHHKVDSKCSNIRQV